MINVISRFKKEDLIDSGGPGKVYKCLDYSGTQVAIKVIKTKYFSRSEVEYHKLITEKNVPHIVRYRGDYSLEKRHCIVMDLVHEKNLAFTRKKLTYPEIQSLVFQTLEFLAGLERVGLVYRDLKLMNMIWCRSSKTLKMVDFGSLHPHFSEAPKEGVSSHTAPPDYILGKRLTGAFDLWSLGCVIYTLFCQKVFIPVPNYGHWEMEFEEGLALTVQRIGLPSANYLKDCSKREKYFDAEGFLLEGDLPKAKNWQKLFLEALDKHKISIHDKVFWLNLFIRLVSYENRGTAEEHLKNPLFNSLTHFHLHYDTAQKCQMFVHRTALLTGKPLQKMGPEDLQNPDLSIDFSEYQGECLHIPKDPNDQYLFILKNGEKSCTAYSPVATGTTVTIKHLQDLVDPPAAEPSSKKVKSSQDVN